ncbi:Ig-like domain-containing protein, partial [Trabulsiella odontotermitis]|uniref:Ig-like domain-containing protein n=1 Tax=Trabulsiella odontotermitis TaxID=379893 RepID=UPI003AC74BA3
MMENKIILAINSGEGKTRLLTADTGKAVNVQLIPGNKYLLKKVNDDFAPENITIKRVGKALHIIQEGDTLPSIIIDDYFNDDPNKPVLLGMAEDGQLYAYAPLSGESYDTGYLIADGNMSPVALGGESVGPGRDIFTATGDNDDSLFGLLGFLAAASAIGVGAAVAMNEGSDDIADHNAPETPAIGETIDNEGAIVGPLKSGDHTDDTTPTLSGRGEPGDTIHIYDKGKEIGSVKVGDDGKWNYTPEKPLDEGEHELTVTEEDPSGNESKPSAPIVINVDTLAPAAPAIQHVIDKVGNVVGEISHNGWTDDTRPEMSGTGEAGATITIYDNGKAIGQTDVNADGRWYFKPTQDLADGNHNFTVTQTDKAGNISEPSNPIQIVVDTVPPVKPDVVNALDDSDPFTGMIQDGGVTNDSRPTFSGGGEPGDTVTLYDGDKVLGTIVIGDDGKWLFAPDEPLTDGDHSFTVTQTDPTGNTSKPSDSLDFAVDTTPPNAGEDVLRITGVADNVGDYQGNVASGDITDDSQPAITGIGEAGNTVFVFSTDAAGRHLIGSAVVDADGTWSLTPDAPLLEGLNSLTLETQDLAGNRIAGEAPSWDITLLIPTGAEPSIISVNDDSEPYVGPLQKGEVTNDSTPTVNGTAAAGDIITIRDGSTILGSVTADSNGRWIFTPDSALADGNHDFTVTATDPAGNRKESGSFPVVIDTTAPSVIADLLIMDNVGEYTGPVNDGDTTDDQSPTFSGTAQAGDIITVFDNGVVLGSAIASDDGKWTYTPETPLVKGKHEITTTVTDPAGNTSEPSPGISFTVDPDPNMVTLGAVKDDQGPVTGSLTDGSVTDDARPELTGSGKPGSVVTIKDGDEVLGSTTVKQDGRWSFTPAGDLADGDHSLMVISVDQAGNDVVSPAFDLTVDTAPPGKPAIAVANDDVGDIRGDLASDSVTDDANPTLKGIAEAGSRVDIYDNGELIGSAVADSNGTWSFTPTTPLPEGGHHLIVTATDRAGNTGPASDRFVLSTDYTPPDSSKVSITSVVDDAGSVTGNMTSGSVTDDNTPLIKGTGAEPGNTITVYNGN